MVPAYHYFTFALIVATFMGACINLFKSMGGEGIYSASLILAMSVAVGMCFFFMRIFALKAQDRAIRAEENLRNFARTGTLLDSRLDIRQIIGLRFASDGEYDELSTRAASEGMSEVDIKKAIRTWKADNYRA